MATPVTELLGGETVLGPGVKSDLDLARATRKGLPSEAAFRLVEMLAADYVFIDLRHLTESRATGRLTPAQSDVVVRTARIFARAVDVLGNRAKAVHWLQTPNQALGGEVPGSLLDTSAGGHEVEAVLDRIEFGVYS